MGQFERTDGNPTHQDPGRHRRDKTKTKTNHQPKPSTMKLSLLSRFWLPVLVIMSAVTAKSIESPDTHSAIADQAEHGLEADLTAEEVAAAHHLVKRAWNSNNAAYANGLASLLSKRGWNSNNAAYANGLSSLLSKRGWNSNNAA